MRTVSTQEVIFITLWKLFSDPSNFMQYLTSLLHEKLYNSDFLPSCVAKHAFSIKDKFILCDILNRDATVRLQVILLQPTFSSPG